MGDLTSSRSHKHDRKGSGLMKYTSTENLKPFQIVRKHLKANGIKVTWCNMRKGDARQLVLNTMDNWDNSMPLLKFEPIFFANVKKALETCPVKGVKMSDNNFRDVRLYVPGEDDV
jgi:hypothetical protein